MWISLKELAGLAGISYRRAAKVIGEARRSAKAWRGAHLQFNAARGRGGAGGTRYEVLLSSIPEELQLRWRGMHAAHEATQSVTHQMAVFDSKRANATGKGRPRFDNTPWSSTERESRHAAFARMPGSVQETAKKRHAAVIQFRALDGSDIPEEERYALTAEAAGISKSTLRRWVGVCKNLDSGDWVVALAPKHRGAQRVAEIAPAAWDFIKAEYFKLSKPALKAVYYRAEHICRERSWALPSYHTVKRLVREEPHWFHVLTRDGAEAAGRLYPAQRRDYSQVGLHEIWCADGRKADVFARWEDGTISRPIVVAWIDVRTRVFLGYSIGRTESADLIRLAFRAAAKAVSALPEIAQMDNGRGFASKLLTGGAPNRYRFKVRDEDIPGILILLGIQPQWAMPYNGRTKPIESFWRTVAEMEKRFGAAYCGNKPDARPEDCDPRKAISIAEYRATLDETIASYHQRPHRGDSMDGRSPRQVYEALISQSIVRQPTIEQLRLCLLAAERVKLNADGSIHIQENRYWHERTASLSREVFYVARFDPEDANVPISLYLNETFICDLPLIERTGFRNQQAAKDYARSSRAFQKRLKLQAADIKGMNDAAAWSPEGAIKPGSDEEAAQAAFPQPKVVQPMRPTQDYRRENAERGGLEEDVDQILLEYERREIGAR